MRISELIARLEELKAAHGDLPVYCFEFDREMGPVSEVEFAEAERPHPSVTWSEMMIYAPDRICIDVS